MKLESEYKERHADRIIFNTYNTLMECLRNYLLYHWPILVIHVHVHVYMYSIYIYNITAYVPIGDTTIETVGNNVPCVFKFIHFIATYDYSYFFRFHFRKGQRSFIVPPLKQLIEHRNNEIEQSNMLLLLLVVREKEREIDIRVDGVSIRERKKEMEREWKWKAVGWVGQRERGGEREGKVKTLLKVD